MITIDNYEAYALDYLEGNLDGPLAEQFELFLSAYPQIAEEMDGLLDYSLTPDSWTPQDTERLIKSPAGGGLPYRWLSLALFILFVGTSAWYIYHEMDAVDADQLHTPIDSDVPMASKVVAPQVESPATEEDAIAVTDEMSEASALATAHHQSKTSPTEAKDEKEAKEIRPVTASNFPSSSSHMMAMTDAPVSASPDIQSTKVEVMPNRDEDDISSDQIAQTISGDLDQMKNTTDKVADFVAAIKIKPVDVQGAILPTVDIAKEITVPDLRSVDISSDEQALAQVKPVAKNRRRGSLLAAFVPTSIVVNPNLKEALLPVGLSISSK